MAGAALLETQGVPPNRIESLPDGADLAAFRPLSPDPELVHRYGLDGKRVVVFLGVLTEYQGVDALLAAVPEVVRRIPDAHFLIMGYPNEDSIGHASGRPVSMPMSLCRVVSPTTMPRVTSPSGLSPCPRNSR